MAAGFPSEEVDDVLHRLERVGLIDDVAFARALTEHQVVNRKAGRRAISAALAQKGVASGIAASVLEELEDDEEERAAALAQQRAARLTGVEPAAAFNRIVGLLQRRGYGGEVARRAARRALSVDAADE